MTEEDRAAVATVRNAVSTVVVAAIEQVILPMVDDRAISMFALMMGISQAHIDNLASALRVIDPATRDPLIASVPEQLRTIIERDGQ